jgi:hypothetical protein
VGPLICSLWYPFDGSASPVYMVFPLPQCRLSMLLLLLCTYLSAFRDRGVPEPTSEVSPRAPAQMGRREAEREGGRARCPEIGERERWKSRGLRVRPAPRSGALAVGDYKRPPGGRSERPYASARLVLVPERPTSSKRALALPFIGVRRGSKCTMGGVAECYVSSGGELAP